MNSTSNPLDRVRPATITAEGYPVAPLSRGEVEEIADVVAPRHLRPADPGRPSDTRVLSVKIAFREPCTLKLGQRVEITIEGSDPATANPASPSSNFKNTPWGLCSSVPPSSCAHTLHSPNSPFSRHVLTTIRLTA